MLSNQIIILTTTSYMDNQFFKFGYTFLENELYNAAEELQLQLLELRNNHSVRTRYCK